MSNPQTIDIFSVNPDWEQIRLRYVALLNPGKSEVGHVSEDTAVSFIPMEDVEEDGTFNGSDEKLLGEVYSGYTYFRDGDVLVAKITPCFENGKGALVDGLTNGLGFGSTEFHVLRASQQIEPRFLFYLTRTHPFRDVGAAMMTGAAGQKRVPDDFLANLMIPCPSRRIQRIVASFLDEKTGQIDELIAKKERLIELLEEKRAALINRAVTKGLDPDVPMKDSGVPWIGEIPEHWDVVSLRHLAKIQTGLTKGRNLDGYDTVRMPYLRVANVQDGYLDLSEIKEIELKRDEVEQYLVRDGDVLMNEGGDFDKLGRGTVWRAEIDRCVHQNHVFVVRPNRLLSSEWLTHFSQAHVAKHYFILAGNQTTNLASISASNLKALPVLLPPASEQKTITRYLAGRLAKLGRIKQIIAEQAGRLQEYRQSLITAAVTGQIDVTEEPTDISEQELAGAIA